MKKITLLTAVLLICLQSFAQVNYRKVPEVTQPIAAYDSLQNIPYQSIKSLFGHKVLILDTINFHPGMDSFKYNRTTSIVNKQFDVFSVKRNERRRESWLVLTSGSDTAYYKLTNGSIENPSFITLGYFEKQTELYTGKKFKLNLPEEFKELNTGIIRKFDGKVLFICAESSIIEEGKKLIPALILKAANGDEIYTPLKGFEITSGNSIQLFTIE